MHFTKKIKSEKASKKKHAGFSTDRTARQTIAGHSGTLYFTHSRSELLKRIRTFFKT